VSDSGEVRGNLKSYLGASVGVAVSGALWGAFWIPLRYLESQGLPGAWPAFVLFAAGAALLLPFVPRRLSRLRAGGREIVLVGALTGSAFALYGLAVVLTDVVTAILLFYLTPVWSTLLTRFYLGQRITVSRVVVLACGFAGMFTILGADTGWPWPRNLGDWLAIASGVMWAAGTFVLYRGVALETFEQVFSFAFGGTVCALLIAISLEADPSAARLMHAEAIGVIALVAVILLATNFLMIIGANLLDPGRVGVLLMLEVVVGVISASVLAGEPFGTRELLGAALIMTAGVAEVFSRPPGLPAQTTAGHSK
jgi:drug/metabolite transporter (DMT)-like permease